MGAVRPALVAAALLLAQMAWPAPAAAHRIDDYLQATLVSLQPGRLHAALRMVPGALTAPAILAAIDTDHDGLLLAREQQAYAERVARDLHLAIDGRAVPLTVAALRFGPPAAMRDGTGEIALDLVAPLPAGGAEHTVVLENRHRPGRAVYLMNALVPERGDIAILAQRRDGSQARYEIDYRATPVKSAAARASSAATTDRKAFVDLFRLGLRHIAGGFDHLLFLLVLLLPAGLVAGGGRWTHAAAISRSVGHLLAIVSAFTLGHSLTLLLAALGGVTLPAAPVEVLIALSVLVSALHAIRPLFSGREAWVAGAFGLVHGLAFATTLTQLGLGAWSRVGGVLAFNLGIEAMQLLVVASVLPALLLMRAAPAYAWLRVAAASIAALAALGWMIERIAGLDFGIDARFAGATGHALPALVGLFVLAFAARAGAPAVK